MFTTLTNNTKDLNNTNMLNCNTTRSDVNWFEFKSIADKYELSKQYATICQQHKKQRKWVLFINPDEASLEQLAKKHDVDISKVLCVNLKDKHNCDNQHKKSVSLNIEQIKNVLSRGNCSAVILSNAIFKQKEIVELNQCAKQGETQCLVLKTTAGKGNTNIH